MTTTRIHQLWLTRPPSTRSSSASEDHPQSPVLTQQQQQQQHIGLFTQMGNLKLRDIYMSQLVFLHISLATNKATYFRPYKQLGHTNIQHLTQLIILSLYTVSILTLDLLILSFNGFHLTDWSYTLCLYLIIVLLLLLYTQMFLRVQFLALRFSPCILTLCLPLLTHTLSYTIHLLMTYNYRCLLPHIEYLSYFTLYSHA